MLFATQSQSIAGAQKYFETSLAQGDYYLGQEVAAHWHGRGADILGLGQGAKVAKEQFFDLLEGKHPVTGERLTQRLRKDRRPGMDLTFSVPKSISLAWAINDDERILKALRETVQETMAGDVEPLMERRVRKGKLANTRQKTPTGKLIYADFLHKTSRPVDGVPDPHLHIHAFVMNWTEDQGKFYAGELEEIVRQRPNLQARFESRLARKLQKLGYQVGHVKYMQSGTLKRGWEIQGVERSTIEKFSRRTTQVEEYAAKHGITNVEAKAQLGKITREKKDKGLSIDRLRSEWRSRLSSQEKAAFGRLTDNTDRGEETSGVDRATQSVKYALDHHLYRQSTVERHQIVSTALEHGLTLRPKDVEQALDSMELIQRKVSINGSARHLVTTRSVLNAERDLIAFARDGRGTRKAIQTKKHKFSREWLNDHQKAAVKYILKSRDTVMAVIGGAGTGKTSLMQEAVEAVHKGGKEVFVFAPSTGAREVLEGKGFNNAQTVEHLIRNTRLHPKLQNQVLWIDEAGLMDVRSMNKVFELAKTLNTRVVLSGDTRQHSSPRRGEAMRLLENEAGLKMARAEKIQRQRGKYRQAVELISKGYDNVGRSGKTGLLAGFDLLDRMGKIKEIPSSNRQGQLAKTYLGAIEKEKSALVVAPTHAEGQAVTAEIRSQLQRMGKLSKDEKAITQYRSLNYSDAEKSEARTYEHREGLIIQFHQNVKGGFKRGERYQVVTDRDGKIELKSINGTQRKPLPLKNPERFEVYSKGDLRIAPGDKVRFSLGGTTKDQKSRISNGRLDEVKGFDHRGNIILKNGWVIDKNYAHIDLGYVITSHAAQGKDRQIAIAAMGSKSLPAINAKQFYVTVSRGREDVTIYVDDKAKVRQAIQRSGEQLSASEMVQAGKSERAHESQEHLVRNEQHAKQPFRDRVLRWWQNLRGERTAGQAIGRHRQEGISKGISLGISPSPSISRSRE